MNNIAIIVAALTFFFISERIFPLRRPTQKLRGRLVVNLSLALLTYLTAMIIVRPLSLRAINFNEDYSFGLLHLFLAPPSLKFIMGFLLLDLSFYYWHRLNHRFSFFWRFHNVHHIDPDLDLSTAFRFHYAEVAYSSLFRVVQLLIIAPSLSLFLSYELVFQVATFFHHSNLRLPVKWDRFLQLFMVTPRMHGIHHSNYQNETNSNYSVIFSLWDRLHHSFNAQVKAEQLEVGVPGYARAEDNALLNLLLAPWRVQRDYWLGRIKRN